MWLLLQATLLLPAIIHALPGGYVAKSAALSVDASAAESPIYFNKGGVGVNFGGYHASAGLGGLLTGDAADGGLHAEAGTPHGQSAGAGLGGAVDANGNADGYYQYAKGVKIFDLGPFGRREEPQTVIVPKETEVETVTQKESAIETFN